MKELKLNTQVENKLMTKSDSFHADCQCLYQLWWRSSLSRQLNINLREQKMTQPRFLTISNTNHHRFKFLLRNSVSVHFHNGTAVKASDTLFHAVLRKLSSNNLGDFFLRLEKTLALFLRRHFFVFVGRHFFPS